VWTLATSVVLETDLTLYELRDDASVLGASPTAPVAIDPTTRAAIAIEGGHTAAALLRDGGEHWFVRVRDGVVVQRLSLPRAAEGELLLRCLGDRYAVDWGGMLDELVLCP
jgi:hypothetical protein